MRLRSRFPHFLSMNRLLALAALLTPLACAADDPAPTQQVTITAQRDAEWNTYRHAYKAAAMFERHTATRPLIQAHMQIRPRAPGASLQGMQVQLAGTSMTMNLAVDGIGRVTMPMIKAAYDEDAVLRLNRQKGYYRFSGRFTIRERADGIYSAAQLREACEQVLGAQRDSGSRFRMMGKKCVGVKFVYAPGVDAAIALRDAAGKESAIAAADAEPFDSGPIGVYRVAVYRFGAWPAQGEIVAPKGLLAIATLYE